MKLAVFAILASSAVAFTPPSMTFAVGKKAAAPAKKAAPMKTVAVAPKKVAAPVKKAVAAPAPKKIVAKVAAPVKKAAPAPVKKIVAKAAPAPLKKVAPKPVPKVVAKVAPKPAPKKVVAKAAPVKKIIIKKPFRSVGVVPSAAIPYEFAPALLDGSLPGDVGFDPCFLSTRADNMVKYFNGIVGGNGPTDGLTWYREAELIHGRIAMLAVVGFVAPGFGTIASGYTDATGHSFGYTNPLEAIGGAPPASLFQILALMVALEFRRIDIIIKDGPNYEAGHSQKWGQGEGHWNPLKFNYTPEQYAEKELQETKHGRLAMIGLLGTIFQANASGVSVVDQLSAAFNTPEYVAKAGYFFPEGI